MLHQGILHYDQSCLLSLFWREETGLNRAVSSIILLFLGTVLHEKWGNPTPWNGILHPILHPKTPLYPGHFPMWCRKCGFFSQNFFCGECRSGFQKGRTGNWKHRTSLMETSVLLKQNIGTFAQRSPMFLISCIPRLISASPIENHFVKPDEQGQVYLC